MTNTKKHSEINIHTFLHARHQVTTIIWSIEDVQSRRPDLKNEQTWLVL